MPESPFDIGDVVHDRDDDDPSDAIVVNTPDISAKDWDIPRLDKTLAEDNPDYPENAATVVVVYEDDLNTYLPAWGREYPVPITQLNKVGVYYYAFPAPRLELIEPAIPESTDSGSETDDPSTKSDASSASDAITTDTSQPSTNDSDETSVDPEPSAAVRELKDRLENGGMTTEIESDGRTIRAEKLGDTYRVRPGEVVNGDGALRTRLETIVTSELQPASSE